MRAPTGFNWARACGCNASNATAWFDAVEAASAQCLADSECAAIEQESAACIGRWATCGVGQLGCGDLEGARCTLAKVLPRQREPWWIAVSAAALCFAACSLFLWVSAHRLHFATVYRTVGANRIRAYRRGAGAGAGARKRAWAAQSLLGAIRSLQASTRAERLPILVSNSLRLSRARTSVGPERDASSPRADRSRGTGVEARLQPTATPKASFGAGRAPAVSRPAAGAASRSHVRVAAHHGASSVRVYLRDGQRVR